MSGTVPPFPIHLHTTRRDLTFLPTYLNSTYCMYEYHEVSDQMFVLFKKSCVVVEFCVQ
jgi:hypothetical protein